MLTVNPTLVHSRLYSSFLVAEIVTDDAEAASALKQEIGVMAQKLSDAIKLADAKAIRATIMEMKGIETLVPTIQGAKLVAAVKVAQKYATQIIAEASGVASKVEEEKKALDMTPIDEFRFAFLDIDNGVQASVSAVAVDAGIGDAPEIEVA